jgi:hypothetical protein
VDGGISWWCVTKRDNTTHDQHLEDADGQTFLAENCGFLETQGGSTALSLRSLELFFCRASQPEVAPQMLIMCRTTSPAHPDMHSLTMIEKNDMIGI